MTKYIVFLLGEQKYSMRLTRINGIEYEQQMVPVPKGPDSVKGIIHLRSEVIPVLNLKGIFGMEDAADSHQLLIAETHGMKVAVEVDVVLGIVNAEEDDIKKVPEIARTDRTACLENVVRLTLPGSDGEEIVISIAVDHIISDHEFGQIEDALEKERNKND